jgi:hypothetical protein
VAEPTHGKKIKKNGQGFWPLGVIRPSPMAKTHQNSVSTSEFQFASQIFYFIFYVFYTKTRVNSQELALCGPLVFGQKT